MTVALVCIATGEKYWQYINPLFQSARKFLLPHHQVLFTDAPLRFVQYQIKLDHSGFPEATLKRYHTFLSQEPLLRLFDHIFYVDIDAVFVSHVGSEILGDGLTATLHHNQNKYDLVEDNKESTAYCDSINKYFAGGFNGGRSSDFLDMARVLRDEIDENSQKGIVARWHDESHLNKYLASFPPSIVLSSDYCYPETELHKPRSPKIVCLDKTIRGGR